MAIKKNPDPVDAELGRRLRLLRLERGLSQEALASAIGVTFQQVQKYENGANRVSASRMQMIADRLGVAPSAFFRESGAPSAIALPADSATLRVARNFAAIADPALRHSIAQVVAAAAGAAAEQ